MACKYKYKDKWYSEIEVKNQILKDISLNDVVVELSTQMSYTVEINTAKNQEITRNEQLPPIGSKIGFNYNNSFYEIENEIDFSDGQPMNIINYYKDGKSIKYEEYNEAEKNSKQTNSSYYSNLTVPGGTNYTENEISTPLITPSIKGHAQFSTDNGIGWFRSDEQLTNRSKVSLGDELKYDDPYIPIGRKKDFKKYEVLNENGNSVGTVVVEYRGKDSVILHPKLDIVGKGYGKALYKFIASNFNVQIQEWNEGAISNSSVAKKMWDSLEKEGVAKRIFDEEQGDNFRVLNYRANAIKTRRILEVQSDWGQKQRKSSEPDINIKYDIQQIINDLQKSGDLKIDCN